MPLVEEGIGCTIMIVLDFGLAEVGEAHSVIKHRQFPRALEDTPGLALLEPLVPHIESSARIPSTLAHARLCSLDFISFHAASPELVRRPHSAETQLPRRVNPV